MGVDGKRYPCAGLVEFDGGLVKSDPGEVGFGLRVLSVKEASPPKGVPRGKTGVRRTFSGG